MTQVTCFGNGSEKQSVAHHPRKFSERITLQVDSQREGALCWNDIELSVGGKDFEMYRLQLLLLVCGELLTSFMTVFYLSHHQYLKGTWSLRLKRASVVGI